MSKLAAADAPSLPVSVAWGTLGAAAYALSQWLLVILIARAGSPADLGQFSLALAIAAPGALLFNLNLRTVVATDSLELHPLRDYFRARAWASAAYVGITLALVLALPLAGGLAALVALVCLAKSVEAASEVAYGAHQRTGHIDRIGVSQCAKALLLVAGFGFAYLASGSILAAAAMLVVSSAVVLVALDLPGVRSQPALRKPALPSWEGLLRTAVPAGAVLALDSLSFNLPRYLLQLWHGESELGFFSSAAHFMIAGATLVGALGISVTPRLAVLYLSDRRAFRRLALASIGWAALAGLVGVGVALAFGSALLGAVYGPAYAAYGGTLVVLMLASALWYAAGLASCAVNAARRFKLNLWGICASLAVLAVAGWLLIPDGGAIGAAWALCWAMAARLACALGAVARL